MYIVTSNTPNVNSVSVLGVKTKHTCKDKPISILFVKFTDYQHKIAQFEFTMLKTLHVYSSQEFFQIWPSDNLLLNILLGLVAKCLTTFF